MCVRLRKRLDSCGLSCTFETPSGPKPIREIGYVDDSVISLVCPAVKVVPKTRETAEVAQCVYAEFGMQLNWLPGKSECLVTWAGPRSVTVKKMVIIDGDSCILCIGTNGSFVMRVVSRYKHIGTIIDSGPGLKSEAAIRSAIIRSEANSFRRVLANCDISVKQRSATAQTYIWSKGLFQAGAWPACVQQ